ncbi:MAG: LCP family protein [Brotaphodocola sp.]
MKYQEVHYEDELDRMRKRQSRKKTIPHNVRERTEHTYRRSEKKHGRRIAIVLFIVVLIAGAWLIKRMQTEEGYWTVAIYGVDSREGNTGKGALADVQLIASLNKKTGEIRLASVFRDTYLQIDSEGDYDKINEAYFLGGYEQAVTALQDNFDLKIDDCVTFNWKAVADVINVLGGIELEITDQEFAYINSFITETVESTGVASTHLNQSGMNHLDGVQAVAYARLRLMDTDFKRTERQRKVIGLAMEKAKQANFKTLKTLVGTVYPEIFTTIRVDDLVMLAKNANKYYISQTSGFPFSHTEMKISKKSCVVPATLESNVVQLHAFLYDDTGYTASDLVKVISAHISKVSGVTEPGKDTESGKNIGAQDHMSSGQSTAVQNSENNSPAGSDSNKGSDAVQTKEPNENETLDGEDPENPEETVESLDPETNTTDDPIDGDILEPETLEDTNPENMEQGPGVSVPNRVHGPGTATPGPAGAGSSTINAGSSTGNALEGPPGESKAPAESAEAGVGPGAIRD